MKQRAPRNRTLTCSQSEIAEFSKKLICLSQKASVASITNRIIHQDFAEAITFLPQGFVDLLIVDPPYNLTKNYNGHVFRSKQAEDYTKWFENVVVSFTKIMQPTASIYVCSDWQTSNLVFPVLDKYFTVQNRITWEREKGRGAKTNWKNNTEDIWFCTCGSEYFFNVDAVKLKRRVIAPYRTDNGMPKDKVSVTVDADVLAAADADAKAIGVNRSELIEQALRHEHLRLALQNYTAHTVPALNIDDYAATIYQANRAADL